MSRAFGSRYNIESSKEAKEYFDFVKDLLDSSVVNEMRKFRHHYSTTCFQHCLNVSYYNYLVCRKLGLNSKEAARAGLLHDLFLYDWREVEKKSGDKPHGMRHPGIALNNAKQYFDIAKREEDMIVKHMWPLTMKLPRYAESYVIVMIDKYIATLELGTHVSRVVKNKYRDFTQKSKRLFS